jgi:hypothetical protein
MKELVLIRDPGEPAGDQWTWVRVVGHGRTLKEVYGKK